MRRSTWPAGLLVALVFLANGCASTGPPTARVESPRLGSTLPRHDPAGPQPPFEAPEGELLLQDALRLALLHNPGLLVFSWEIRAREAEELQAGLRPNLELGAEIENFGGTGIASGLEGAESTLTLSHLVELGGKRSKRLAVRTARSRSGRLGL